MSHYDLYQSIRESKAQRYLAQKRFERLQRFTNNLLACGVAFIVTATIATGLFMWADALA
tara:strand:+ start:244 stop:423 length:180 start_codon:yes stop_codon:yes gene_type:complete